MADRGKRSTGQAATSPCDFKVAHAATSVIALNESHFFKTSARMLRRGGVLLRAGEGSPREGGGGRGRQPRSRARDDAEKNKPSQKDCSQGTHSASFSTLIRFIKIPHLGSKLAPSVSKSGPKSVQI